MKPNILLLPGLLNDASVFTEQIAALSTVATVEVGDLTIAESITDLAASVLKLASAKRFVLLGCHLAATSLSKSCAKHPSGWLDWC